MVELVSTFCTVMLSSSESQYSGISVTRSVLLVDFRYIHLLWY